MPQSLSKIYVHIIFSTKNRFPFLTKVHINKILLSKIEQILIHNKAYHITTNCYRDHVHILCVLPKDKTISKLVWSVKCSTSKLMKENGGLYDKFFWQHGYAAFSVSYYDIEKTRKYIINQQSHHNKIDFQEEFLKFLEENHINYDKRFLWD